jgi:hypothetical protein
LVQLGGLPPDVHGALKFAQIEVTPAGALQEHIIGGCEFDGAVQVRERLGFQAKQRVNMAALVQQFRILRILAQFRGDFLEARSGVFADCFVAWRRQQRRRQRRSAEGIRENPEGQAKRRAATTERS